MIEINKITIPFLQQKKTAKQPIIMLTAYDYPSAVMVDEAGVDIILVGDTVAMTVLGHPNTVSITVDEMLHHCKAVSRGAKRSFLVGDMPFLSYQIDPREAVRNAGRFLKEAYMDAVKLEGGRNVADTVKAIAKAGIPIMGHVGLTPQTATKLGGYKVQAKTAAEAKKLLDDAIALEVAGCFAIVLEAVPARVAEIISNKVNIPTIGIGAGPYCDGQVLVYHDILGLFDQFVPKFVKKYADIRTSILAALKEYCDEVGQRKFPTLAHSFKMEEQQLKHFLDELK